jgi:hypothetical protein
MTSTTTTQPSMSIPKSNILKDSTESSPAIQRLNESEIESLLKKHLLLEEDNDEGNKLWNSIRRYCAYKLDSSEYEILSELSHYLLVRCCSLNCVLRINCIYLLTHSHSHSHLFCFVLFCNFVA